MISKSKILNFVLLISSVTSLFASKLMADVNPEAKLPKLHQAIIKGDINQVREYIKEGADVNQLDRKMGNSPLQIAVQTDHTHIVKYLIENGAFVNLQAPRSGFSPLMIAVWYSKIDNIKTLLDVPHINIHLKTPQGLTAEDWIGGWDRNIDENERLIIDEIKGLFETFKEKQQKVIESQSLTKVLLDKSLSVEEKTQRVAKFLEKGEPVNTVQPIIGNGNDAHTPLLIAARSGYTKIVELLLEADADQTKPGWMMNAVAFHKAAYTGRPEVLKLLVKNSRADLVINDVGPNNGYTPLHDAIWHGHTEAAKILIDAGARLDLKNYEGDTPLMLAKRYKYEDIVSLLQKL